MDLSLGNSLLIALVILVVLILVGFLNIQTMFVVRADKGVKLGLGLGMHLKTEMEGWDSGTGLLQEAQGSNITATMPSDLYYPNPRL